MPHSPPHVPLRLWLIALVTGSGAFMAMLDSTVANLALDPIRRDFGVPLANVQWVATCYLISLAVSLPLTGWLSRRFGNGLVWRLSMVFFVGTSIACALAPSLNWLIPARCLQGLGAGLMVPAGQALLAGYADRRQLGRLMGTVGFAVALGPAFGPAVGGYLADIASWRWLFWINTPIGLAAILASLSLVPNGEAVSDEALDWKSVGLLATGLPALLYGAADIGAHGLTPTAFVCVVVGAGLIGVFYQHARFCAAPLIDLGLLTRPGFAPACAIAGLTGASMFGGLFLLPLYLQQHLAMTTTGAGLMLLVLGLGSAVALPIAGILTDRYGPVFTSIGGAMLLVVGTAPFISPLIASVIAIAALFLTRGAGLALTQMPAMTAAYTLVDTSEKSDAAALINVTQRIGGALGVVAVVITVEHGNATNTAISYQWAFALLALFAIAAIVIIPKLSPASVTTKS